MASVYENNPAAFPIFRPLTIIDKLNQKISEVVTVIYNAAQIINVKWSDIIISKSLLAKTVERVEKRKVYLHVFHNGLQIGELNETVLLGFWMVRLCPFYIKTGGNVNVRFAAYLICSAIQYVARQSGRNANINVETMNDLCYALRYQDISKEALMYIAKSMIY
jgi:galactitol-specific phosphotransferase system IIB component